MKERSQESERIMEWGLREFDNYNLFKAGEVVAEADAWLGKEATVPLTVADDAVVTLSRVSRGKMVVKAVYDAPIRTPIQKGAKIATLVVTAPDTPEMSFPLVAGADVERKGVFGRFAAALKYLLFGASS